MTVPPSTLAQFDISGRSAFVTGGASGIGLAYVEAMAEAGAKVTLSDVSADNAEREAARLRGRQLVDGDGPGHVLRRSARAGCRRRRGPRR